MLREPLTFTHNNIKYGFWGVTRLYSAAIATACGFTKGNLAEMGETTQQRGDLPCHEVRATGESGTKKKKTFVLKVAPAAAGTVLTNLPGETIRDRDDTLFTIYRVRPKNN